MRNDPSPLVPLGERNKIPDGFWFNIGPPMRSMRTRITVTVLGNPEISVAWPRTERVGLIFENDENPLAFVEGLLKKEGFRSPEELRPHIEIPQRMLTCRAIGDDADGLLKAGKSDALAVLRQALILGLCGPNFYDPNRAVIWTNNRLSRKLDLFEPGRFYADN